jgi:hypothetical protein
LPAPDGIERDGVAAYNLYTPSPIVVTKDNAKEAFKDDPDRLALLAD